MGNMYERPHLLSMYLSLTLVATTVSTCCHAGQCHRGGESHSTAGPEDPGDGERDYKRAQEHGRVCEVYVTWGRVCEVYVIWGRV